MILALLSRYDSGYLVEAGPGGCDSKMYVTWTDSYFVKRVCGVALLPGKKRCGAILPLCRQKIAARSGTCPKPPTPPQERTQKRSNQGQRKEILYVSRWTDTDFQSHSAPSLLLGRAFLRFDSTLADEPKKLAWSTDTHLHFLHNPGSQR